MTLGQLTPAAHSIRAALAWMVTIGVSAQLAVITAAADLPSDSPAKFQADTSHFDYVERDEMIPMRDGIKLRTIILIPKSAHSAPMLMTRTPYDASAPLQRFNSPHLTGAVLEMVQLAAAEGYIIVTQDVRGKHGSEGGFIMNRPLRGPLNAGSVDESTDAYDTIDWLVKHVPESNGRIGLIGGSYDGFTTLMGTIHPHPALKAVVPFSPMVDGWIGDDWFHNGAFRQDGSLDYIYEEEVTRGSEQRWWSGIRDTYQAYLEAGSAGAMAQSHGLSQLGFWRDLATHPAYDEFWQDQAVDQLLAAQPIKVPMLLVDGLFDQEDIYGGPAVFQALAPKDPHGQFIHLVLGPWNHGQGRTQGRGIGPILFEGDTATWLRRTVMQPFLDYYLKDGPKPNTPRVLVYETGADQWHRYDAWPRSCSSGCSERSRPLYLLPGGTLGFTAPTPSARTSGPDAYDQYSSDPAKPVPYRASRPTLVSADPGSNWSQWLVDDQRNAASRPDVLVYQTAPLQAPLRIAGAPLVQLYASTTGSDADWVVKIIDVWPDEVPSRPELGGYQQMLSADIFRGRYREDRAHPHPIASNQTLLYRFHLPNASHTFLPGHRIMVQIQSSWFPLYDRNPQRFVPNIMFAAPEDYIIATQRIWHTSDAASAIDFPVIANP